MDIVLSAPCSDGTLLAWDLRTGVVKQSFRQAACVPGGVAVVHGTPSVGNTEPGYILAAQSHRPTVNAYEWDKGNLMFKCSMPEVLRTLRTTKNGMFAIGGGGSGNLYVWETSSGRLLRVFAAHFKAVTCGAFSDDSSFFVSGGDDGIVKVWWLEDLIRDPKLRGSSSGTPTPVTVYSGHMLPITALAVTQGGARGRIISVSNDKTLRVWTLASPHPVATVNVHCTPTAIALGLLDSCVFLGSKEGKVMKVQLSSFIAPGTPSTFPAVRSHAGEPESKEEATSEHCSSVGEHSGGVLSIAISSCATLLLTGGAASGVHVWDIASGQLMKTFDNHKAGIASLHILPVTTYTFNGKKPLRPLPLGPLKKFTGSGTTWPEGYEPVVAQSSGPLGAAADSDNEEEGIAPLSSRKLRKRMWEVVAAEEAPAATASSAVEAAVTEQEPRKRSMVDHVIAGEAGQRERVQQLEEQLQSLQEEVEKLRGENKRWEQVSKKLFKKAKGSK